jgi:hypothetical protein
VILFTLTAGEARALAEMILEFLPPENDKRFPGTKIDVMTNAKGGTTWEVDIPGSPQDYDFDFDIHPNGTASTAQRNRVTPAAD